MSDAIVTRGSAPTQRSTPATVLFALLALWSLVYDGFVLQTHRHPPDRPAIEGRAAGTGVSATIEEGCALCAAAAATDPVVPPAAVRLVPPVAAAAVVVAPMTIVAAPVMRAHFWRSRAPPASVPHP